MFSYPSIPGSYGQAFTGFDAYVFDKLDGRNVRFYYTKKRGWHKQGTRERLFDLTDKDFGPSIKIFNSDLAEPLAKILHDKRLDKVTAFCEYWGENSLAGALVPGDSMHLSLIDIAVEEELLGPREYVKTFVDKVPTARYVGRYHWTRGFCKDVYEGKLEDVSLEGVVGKSVKGDMAKAKTKQWLDLIKSRYAPAEAEKIINS